MKQLLQDMRSGETRVVDVPRPQPGPGKVLVETAASLVSAGTERMVVEFASRSLLGKARARPDLVKQVLDKARREGVLPTIEAAFNRLDQPLALGYSSAGTVAALGPGVSEFRVGQRVACAGGGFAVHAEYGAVPVNLVAGLPDEVDFESAAFATLGAIALHGFRLADSRLGERVAVIGLGLLGLLAVQIARAAGCAVFGVDLDPARVKLAKQLGAAAVERSGAEEAAASTSKGRGFDSILICADTSSNDPVELAGQIARDRARVVAVGAVGLHIPRKVYYEKELSFVNSRSYGPGRYDPDYEEDGQDYPLGYVRWTEGRNLQAVVRLMGQRQLDVSPLISHRFSIDQAPQAYELITGKTGEPFLGVLLTYPGQSEKPASKTAQVGEGQPGLAAPAVVPLQRTDPVRLGVLGAGNFAMATLLPAIQKVEGVELVGVASGSGRSAEHARRKFGFRYAAEEAVQLFEDDEINTLAVLTRHHLHAGQVLQGLDAGKHVFCEKPLALTPEELEEISQKMEALSAPGSLLMVGYNRRFAPLAQKLQAFLAGRSEPLVAHYRINAGYIPLDHWVHDPKQGGGRLVGESCHFIDFLSFLVGLPPSAVQAQALPDGGRYREDVALITLSFPDGSLGTVHYLANGAKAFAKERVEVFCGGRAAALDDFRSLELVSESGRQVVRSRLRQDKGHRGEWEALAAVLRAGGPPPVPYEQIFGGMQATFGALEALRTGRRIQF